MRETRKKYRLRHICANLPTFPWKTDINLRDHSSSVPDDPVVHAGGLATAAPAPSYGDQRVSRAGLVVTVVLHMLLVLAYLYRPQQDENAAPPSGTAITYISAVPAKPKVKAPQTAAVEPVKREPRDRPVKPVKERRQEVVNVQRLPDTITPPDEPSPAPQTPAPAPPEPQKVDPAEDMSARIAARQRARQEASGEPAAETEDERANRIARANIESANGKSRGEDDVPLVTVTTHSFNAATINLRGYDSEKRRRTLQQLQVELGMEKDIQTASVVRMIAFMRSGGLAQLTWTSGRLNKKVELDLRPGNDERLKMFLFAEMFPGYQYKR